MSEDEVQQTDETTPDAPEAAADDTPEAEVESGDAQMADTVDERASELTGSGASTVDSPRGEGDPIADAEAHLATVDMDEERKKVQKLSDKL